MLTCGEVVQILQRAAKHYGESAETNIERVAYPVAKVGGGNALRFYTDMSESFNDLDDLQCMIEEVQEKLAKMRREETAG